MAEDLRHVMMTTQILCYPLFRLKDSNHTTKKSA